MKQSDLAAILGRDPGWISNQLKGPGNWTLRTFGELVEAMDGEVEVQVLDRNEPLALKPNFDAYAVFDSEAQIPTYSSVANFGASVPVTQPKSSTSTVRSKNWSLQHA